MSNGGSLYGGKVVLVDDDHHDREILSDELSERGFFVQSFCDGASLLGALDTTTDADVVVIDWKPPRTSGIELLPQLRHHGVNLPVVFLAAHALPAHEIMAFERGAIDFIDKGRGMEVLVRRLKRVVEACKPAADSWSDSVIASGRLVLRPGVSRAYWDEMDLGLTIGEFNTVHLLASNVGRCVTYRSIYDRMTHEGFIAGSGDDGYRANVRSAIKRIRNKFRKRDPAFVEIENYTSLGYCWGRPAPGQHLTASTGVDP
jgi:two-component system, OmpR family, response regulator ChvI